MKTLFNKKRFYAAALFFINSLVVPASADAQPADSIGRLNIGLAYPISTNGREAAQYTNVFSFNVLTGVSKEEKAFTFAGISNIIRDKAAGLQFAGISNHIRTSSRGVLFAGISNLSGTKTEGLQFAGILNHADTIRGIQFGGLLNHAKSVEGMQFAGLSNVVKGDIKGIQFAGLLNKAKDIKGGQFAGLVNKAGKVKGFQFAGLVNIADSSDTPIGLINIIRNGEKSIGLSFDEIQSSVLSFRSGGRVLYGILGIGYNWKADKDNLLVAEAGFGAHLSLSPAFRINTELVSSYLEDWKEGEYFKNSIRVLPALKFSGLEVFAGPSFNFSSTDTEYGKKLVKNDVWNDTNGNQLHQLFIGYTAGIQLHL